jgi:hypothetical protein
MDEFLPDFGLTDEPEEGVAAGEAGSEVIDAEIIPSPAPSPDPAGPADQLPAPDTPESSETLPAKTGKRPKGLKNPDQVEAASPQIRKAVNQLFDQLGRDQVLATLDFSDDPKAQQLMALLVDPRNAHEKFNTLSRQEGLFRLNQALPDVMEDVAKDSRNQIVPCTHCNEERYIRKTEKVRNPDWVKGGDEEKWIETDRMVLCPACYGRGEVELRGSKDARNLMMESLGLTGQKGPLIAQQINIGGASSHEDEVRLHQKLLESRKD